MNSNLKNILLIAGIAIITVLIYFKIKEKKALQAPAQTQQNKGPATVSGKIITTQLLENIIRTTGTIMPDEVIELHAEYNGRIEKILFTEGAVVSKNQLLIKINDADLQAQLSKINLQIQLAESNEKRQKQLLDISATSREGYDAVLNQLNTLQADKQLIQSTIAKTEIRAPFNGEIGLRYVSEGAYITAATKIASIQKIDPVKIDFAVPEKYSSEIKKGQQVKFTNDATLQNFKGTVYASEPGIEAATRTLQVRAKCDNSNGKIIPGSFVKVELQLSDIKDAVMIPTQALIPVMKGQTVFICKDGKAKSVAVKTGIRTDVTIQITDGLMAGDTLITSGIMQLRPETPLKVIIKNGL